MHHKAKRSRSKAASYLFRSLKLLVSKVSVRVAVGWLPFPRSPLACLCGSEPWGPIPGTAPASLSCQLALGRVWPREASQRDTGGMRGRGISFCSLPAPGHVFQQQLHPALTSAGTGLKSALGVSLQAWAGLAPAVAGLCTSPSLLSPGRCSHPGSRLFFAVS